MAHKGSGKRTSESQPPSSSLSKRAHLLKTNGISLTERMESISWSGIVELVYEFTVPDNSLLMNKKTGEFFSSPIFYAKSHKNIKWQIKIFPNGRQENSKGYLSVYLCRVYSKDTNNPPVTTRFNFVLLKNGNELCSEPVAQPMHYSYPHREWGSRRFLSLEDLQIKGHRKYELKIVCSLVCEINRLYISSPVQ